MERDKRAALRATNEITQRNAEEGMDGDISEHSASGTESDKADALSGILAGVTP